jgi:hypothetical protein
MNDLDNETLQACEAGPPGDNPTPADRHRRNQAAYKLHGWLRDNAHRYPNAQAAKSDACQFVLTTMILGAVLTAVIEWVVGRVLRRWFGE